MIVVVYNSKYLPYTATNDVNAHTPTYNAKTMLILRTSSNARVSLCAHKMDCDLAIVPSICFTTSPLTVDGNAQLYIGDRLCL